MRQLRKNAGLTLIELLVALVLSSILIAALYRTFISQHKTYSVQEQVVDMQQNARAAIFRVVREIRMAGFGKVAGEYVPGVGYVSRILPVQFTGTKGETIICRNILNRGIPDPGCLTFIGVTNSVGHTASLLGVSSRFQIVVDKVEVEKDHALFDIANKRYISIDGVESNAITKITEENSGSTKGYLLTLEHPLQYHYESRGLNEPGALIFPITAISFQLVVKEIVRENVKEIVWEIVREEIGSGQQPIGGNMKERGLTFEYFNARGETTANDRDIRMVRVAVTGETSMGDPDFLDNKRGNKGYRTRQMASNIQIRNLALAP
jgi:prepilin-type N-terminal cleavage/methylation domain-containing protein